VEYGAPITLDEAKQVMAGAETEAVLNGWPMVIAIVDSGGNLVMLHRMDHTQYGSIEIAQLKAATAVNFKRPTKLFQDLVQTGGVHMRLLAMPNMLPLEGGIPLIRRGKIVGAIGVSGMQSGQDAQVAEAGAAALG
jgi:uncharacterized protein GlcG (DUF336 family)